MKMKATVLFTTFGLFLTWLQPTEGQRDSQESVRIPPSISSMFPKVYYMPHTRPGIMKRVIHKCDQARGIPTPVIYWQYYKKGIFQNRLYPQNSERTYNGSQLLLKDIHPDEQYQCVAQNSWGTALSTKIRVKEAAGSLFDRKIKTNPYTYNGIVGQPLLIPCHYVQQGIPADNFMWRYRDGTSNVNVELDDRIFISDNGSLAFSYLTADDGGKEYVCFMENSVLNLEKYGSWSKLEVSGSSVSPDMPTSLLYATKNNTVAEYDKQFQVQCIFGGNPVPTVQWERPHNRQTGVSEDKQNLLINRITEEDEGFYKCTSEQKLGNPMTVTFYIDVKGPPIWVQKPESLIVAQGQQGVFYCNARELKGEKALDRPIWYKNGKPFSQSVYGSHDGKYEISADGKKLTIHDPQKRNDICNFQCSVRNDEGEVFADAAFNVILNTEVLLAPQSQTIDRGDVATFDIRAQTDPLKEKVMQYTWILNGRKIEFLDLFDIYLLPNNSLVVNTTGMDQDRFDVVLGNYSVKISNGVEVVTRYASLMANPANEPVVSESGMDMRWIALIVAVVLLFIIFILLLCVLFNRHGGDDYSVDKKERKAGHDPEKELADSGFHDLPRTYCVQQEGVKKEPVPL